MAQPLGWSFCNTRFVAKVETEFAITFREPENRLMLAEGKVEALSFLRQEIKDFVGPLLVSPVSILPHCLHLSSEKQEALVFVNITLSILYHIFPASSKGCFLKYSLWTYSVMLLPLLFDYKLFFFYPRHTSNHTHKRNDNKTTTTTINLFYKPTWSYNSFIFHFINPLFIYHILIL